MNQQERQVIEDIFRRLEQVADQPRDPEAERFIADKIRQQPYAPYAMAQAVYVQEQALANLHERVQQLEAELEQAQSQRSSGGIFGNLFGGGSREPDRQRPMGGPFGQRQPDTGGAGPWGGGQQGPWGGAQPGAMGQGGPFGGQRQGGGFLGTAMATAAGVAGGMMLGNVLRDAFGGGAGSGGEAKSALGDTGAGQGDAAGGQDHSSLSPFQNSADSGQDASYQHDADFGGDFGGDAGGDY
jgi:hypothetical protein